MSKLYIRRERGGRKIKLWKRRELDEKNPIETRGGRISKHVGVIYGSSVLETRVLLVREKCTLDIEVHQIKTGQKSRN